jgi:hypothetical protein
MGLKPPIYIVMMLMEIGYKHGEKTKMGEQNFVELVTNFLQSDDLVAVRIRKQLKDKSLQKFLLSWKDV